MATIEEENAALEARITQLEASLGAAEAPALATEPSGYGWKQGVFDVGVGVTRGVAGLADLLAYLPTKGLQYAGVPTETWGASKLVDALIESDQGLPGRGVAEILGLEPKTKVQEAVEFMTPGPGGKGRLGAQLAREAALGLTAYTGKEVAEGIAPESPYAGIAGAILAPLSVQGLTYGAGRLASALVPTAKVITGNEEALRAAAQAEILQRVGEEGTERLRIASMLPQLQTGTGGLPLTAAEIAQTPGGAQLQQSLLSTPEGAQTLLPAIQARKAEIGAELESLGITSQQGEMAIALRDAAETAAQQKQAQEAGLLQGLGFGAAEQAATPFERGKSLQQSLMLRKEDVEDIASAAWEKVPGKTKIDASTPFAGTMREYANFGELAKADTSAKAQRVMNKVYDLAQNKNGIVSVDELQDLRSAAGRAMAEASGVNPREAKLMSMLRENIDNAGLSYAYDPTVGARGGLPGTAATKPDLEALTKLSEAIGATRAAKETFSQGAIGDITAIRQFKPKLQASKVIKKATETPENIMEVSKKVGFESGEMTEIRMQLLSDLTSAKNPTEYLGKEKSKFKVAFGDQYTDVENFAQKRGQKAPLEEFARVTDSAIPNKIFADQQVAARFAKEFANSPLLPMARAKFISERLTKRGDAIENLSKNKKIAEKLFQSDLPQLQKVLADLEVSKSPARLERELASGNSITSVRQTSLGALFSARAILKPGTVVGAIADNIVSKIRATRRSQINRFASEMMADPRLLKFAEAPPTKENINALFDVGTRLGFFGGKAAIPETEAKAEMSPIEAENMQLEERIKAIESSLSEAPTPKQESVKIGKQDVSIPEGEGYAPPDLVKAVMQVESAGKPKAVSSKGAAGLMQLMPATAKDLGVEDRFDPEQNVEGGSRYLAQQLKEFGQPELALAAYNWGPRNIENAVAKLRAEKKDVTWENVLSVVKVPRETREYVNKVMSLV